MLRAVQDLTRDELDELKQNYVCEVNEGAGTLTYWSDSAEAAATIPDEVLFEYYAGTNFSEDDFWCNIKTIQSRT